ncbi:MAG: hypothetical protein ACI31M_02025 [Bacilli bacterium]
MGLFDVFKKKKKEEELDQTIALETPVFDTPVVESQVESASSKESVLEGSGIVENEVNNISTDDHIENNIDSNILGVEPLPENAAALPVDSESTEEFSEPISVNNEETESMQPIPEFESEKTVSEQETISEETESATVIEPLSAETIVPTSEEFTETPVTSLENPTASVAEEPVNISSDDDDTKFCPNCGNMETGGTIICSNCGSRL